MSVVRFTVCPCLAWWLDQAQLLHDLLQICVVDWLLHHDIHLEVLHLLLVSLYVPESVHEDDGPFDFDGLCALLPDKLIKLPNHLECVTHHHIGVGDEHVDLAFYPIFDAAVRQNEV